MYTVNQVADLSGVSERTIWRMIANGTLEHTREGRRVWIAECDVPEARPTATGPVVAQLRAELAQLRARVDALEMIVQAHPDGIDASVPSEAQLLERSTRTS